MGYSEEIDEVRKRYDEAGERYKKLKQKYDDAAEWVYASWDMYQLEPYYSERHTFPKGRIVKNPEGAWRVKHGLDSDKNCIITLQPTEFGTFYETFFEYTPDAVWSYRYSYNKQKDIINVSKFEFSDGAVTRVITWASGGNSISEYEYSDSQLQIERNRYNQDPDNLESTIERIFKYEHDAKGLISISEGSYFWYYRLSKKEFTQYKNTALEELCSSIKSALSCTKELVCRIALLYEDEIVFPLTVMVLTEKDLQSTSMDRVFFVDHPCEWEWDLTYEFNEELMNRLNTIAKVSRSKFRELEKVIEELAFRLNLEIDEYLPLDLRTENFLITYCDFDGNGISKNGQKLLDRAAK